jgi:jasmonic acid-amino synthetase
VQLGLEKNVMCSCANSMDLAFVDVGYVGSRKIKTIGALELRIFQKGTFGLVMDHYISLGGGVSKFKTPRFVSQSNSKVFQILSRNVTRSYFSTLYEL